MNDEPEELTAKSTLCWQCKYGMTIQEVEQEHVYHQNLKNLSEEDDFPLTTFDQDEDMPQEHDIIEHTVQHQRIKTICYWRPEGVEHSPPIGVAFVKQCSRFEEREPKS